MAIPYKIMRRESDGRMVRHYDFGKFGLFTIRDLCDITGLTETVVGKRLRECTSYGCVTNKRKTGPRPGQMVGFSRRSNSPWNKWQGTFYTNQKRFDKSKARGPKR